LLLRCPHIDAGHAVQAYHDGGRRHDQVRVGRHQARIGVHPGERLRQIRDQAKAHLEAQALEHTEVIQGGQGEATVHVPTERCLAGAARTRRRRRHRGLDVHSRSTPHRRKARATLWVGHGLMARTALSLHPREVSNGSRKIF
jgi:hypothetical protein